MIAFGIGLIVGILLMVLVLLSIVLIKEVKNIVNTITEYENTLTDKEYRNFKIFWRNYWWGIKNDYKK